MLSNHMYQDVHFNYKVLWHPKKCSSFYKPAHHLKCVQLLSSTANIFMYLLYMSTSVTADALCYVTQCYHCTPESLSSAGGLYYFCILPKLSITSG